MKIKRSSRCTTGYLTAKKKDMLSEVMEEYSRLVNEFMGLFWPEDFRLKDLKKEVTQSPHSWLSARMRQCAAREALGMVQGAKTKAKNKEEAPILPKHSGKKMILSAQIAQAQKGHNSFDGWLVLTSIGRKLKISIPLKFHRHFNQFASWRQASTVAIHREFIQFSFEEEIGEKKTEGKLVGIDVGINHLLATSEGALIGSETKPLIEKIKHKQQGSKGQQKARKTLSYFLHKTVKNYFENNPDLRLVVVEQLKYLKRGKSPKRNKAFRKTLNAWNYRELLEIIQMRAEENRVSFRSVNPYKTSQTCPNGACSHIERGNRVGEKFQCLRCGYANQADLVGSLNILTRFTSGPYGAAFQT